MSVLPTESRRSWRRALAGGLLLLSAAALQADDSRLPDQRLRFHSEPLAPVPLRLDIDPRKRELGRQLFFDPRLAADGETTCASCHPLPPIAEGAVIEFPRSVMGEYQRSVGLLYNVGDFFWFNWDGRFSRLEPLISAAIGDPNKMNSNWDDLIKRLQPVYGAEFATIHRRAMTREDVVEALALFLRSLSAPNARFDRYLRGEQGALSEAELAGYRLFIEVGCASCHNGRSIGANFFEQFYIYRHEGGQEGEPRLRDKGRYYVTGDSADNNLFRVPTLRNVVLTAPYFHDGSAEDLYHAIEEMAEHQLGIELSANEIELLEAFLNTLTGHHPGVQP